MIKYLVIHCTDTPAGMRVLPEDIRFWHTAPPPKGRGWKQVGYSDMILLNGVLINLVPYDDDNEVDPWEITNGVKGINGVSRHVVYVGGKPAKDTRTKAQEETMRKYVLDKIARYPDILVAGHRQFDPNKACPSFDVPTWLRSIGVEEKNIYKTPALPMA
jgi:hypothetical protein